MVDADASKYGLSINAAKTKMMVVGRPTTLPTFQLSGKELLVTDTFLYFGSFFADGGSMRRETDDWNVHALAAVCQMQDIWAGPKLSNNKKWMCIVHFVCPCLRCAALQSEGFTRKALVVAQLFLGISGNAAWPQVTQPLARDPSSGGGTCLGQRSE
eukprot:353376-Chlamydomonas_euryale.AAC.5